MQFKIKGFAFTGLMLFTASVFAQTGSPVIFTYKNNPVSTEEFEYQYLKNKRVGDETITEKDIDDYLDLYIKFKLKYQDARDAGMDTLKDYIAELAGYRAQLARNYLYDKEVTDELINEAYDRMKWEVRAAHILVMLPPDAKPEDTLKAYNKIKASLDRINMRKNTFEVEAKNSSEDPGSKDNGGDLGYFTALQLVYPFETVAYNTPVGEMSGIFRTQFGYHIIKVLDKRPNRGEIKVRHIQLRVGHKPDATSETVEQMINEIYNKIISGESTFEKMAYAYSEDYNSKYQGGEMDYISVTQFVGDPERQHWADMAFSLEKDGDITKPFRTALGWHILQRVSVRPLGTFDQLKNTLKSQVRNDQRSQKSIDVLIEKVKNENHFTEYSGPYTALESCLDTNFTAGHFKKSSLPKYAKTAKPTGPVRGNVFNEPNMSATPLVDLQMFQLGDEKYTVGEFASYLEKNSKPLYGDIPGELKTMYNKWVNDQCVYYQDKHLEEKSVEFRNIYQEYSEGILMFYRKKEMVWDKANSDSAGLADFFAKHREDYKWKDRIHCQVYFCSDENTMKKVAKEIKKKIPADSIKASHNRSKALSVDYKTGKYEESDNYLFADKSLLPAIFSNPKSHKNNSIIQMGKFGDDYVVVKIQEFMPAGYKELKDTRGTVIARYEEYLEDQWVKDLESRYTVVVNNKEYDALKKKLLNK